MAISADPEFYNSPDALRALSDALEGVKLARHIDKSCNDQQSTKTAPSTRFDVLNLDREYGQPFALEIGDEFEVAYPDMGVWRFRVIGADLVHSLRHNTFPHLHEIIFMTTLTVYRPRTAYTLTTLERAVAAKKGKVSAWKRESDPGFVDWAQGVD